MSFAGKPVLVTGGAGGLGRYVVRELLRRGVAPVAPPREALDVTSRGAVDVFVGSVGRGLAGVMHLAALADVDRCADDPVAAALQNAAATSNVAAACAKRGVSLVYMSTNDVFSEVSSPGPFCESDLPAPGMAYSWSKFAGEAAVLAAGGLVVRANFFTRHCRAKRSFATYVLGGARGEHPLLCYENVLASPVFAGTLAERLVDAFLSGERDVLHVASSDWTSRADQARAICRAYGLSDEAVVPTRLTDRRGRPLDARLRSERRAPAGTVAEEAAKLAEEESL